ncbi:hypothetical protein ACFL0Z_02420 [Patescibacteria group bacterium]
MTKYSKVVVAVTVAAAMAVGFTAVAATPAYTDVDNTFTSVVNWFKKGITIGEQGEGGVTFYNGTIVNNTTDSDGNENPVTVGDKMRIDSTIFRMEEGGTYPVQFGDSIVPTINNTYNIGTSTFKWKDLHLSGGLNVDGVSTLRGAVTQDRGDIGTAKAAATVAAAGTITRSVANIIGSNPTFTIVHSGTGIYEINFGFKIDDRYIVVQPANATAADVEPLADVAKDNQTATVRIVDTDATDAAVDNGFDILVF